MTRWMLRLTLLALISGTALLVVGAAHAASFLVTTTADSTDLHPGDGVCDDGSGACSLRAAVMETNALPGDDTISVPPGTYNLTVNTSAETGAEVGDLDITSNLVVQGSGAETTIISGHVLDRNFHIQPEVSATLSGLTITGGDAASNHVNGLGGNIYNEGGSLTIIDCVISEGTGYGGGLANDANGTVLIRGTWVDHNGYDGGITNFPTATMTIEHSRITNNSTGSSGGITNTGTLTVTDTTFSGNSAHAHAGAISNSGPAIFTATGRAWSSIAEIFRSGTALSQRITITLITILAAGCT